MGSQPSTQGVAIYIPVCLMG